MSTEQHLTGVHTSASGMRTSLAMRNVTATGSAKVVAWDALQCMAHRNGAVNSGGDEAVWAARLQAAHRQQRRHGALVHTRQLGVYLRKQRPNRMLTDQPRLNTMPVAQLPSEHIAIHFQRR